MRWVGWLLVAVVGACASKVGEPAAAPVVMPVASVSATPAETPSPNTTPMRARTDDKVTTAVRNDLRILLASVEMWRVQHSDGGCPSIEWLVRDKEISASSRLTDPWGNTYLVICSEDDSRVFSSGPDGRPNTADDIVVPEHEPAP